VILYEDKSIVLRPLPILTKVMTAISHLWHHSLEQSPIVFYLLF